MSIEAIRKMTQRMFIGESVQKHESIQLPGLVSEVGVTYKSLANAKVLKAKYGDPVRIELISGTPEDVICQVLASYNTGNDRTEGFIFTGFSWGYRGEGPHGLLEFLKMSGIPCTIEQIATLPEQSNGDIKELLAGKVTERKRKGKRGRKGLKEGTYISSDHKTLGPAFDELASAAGCDDIPLDMEEAEGIWGDDATEDGLADYNQSLEAFKEVCDEAKKKYGKVAATSELLGLLDGVADDTIGNAGHQSVGDFLSGLSSCIDGAVKQLKAILDDELGSVTESLNRIDATSGDVLKQVKKYWDSVVADSEKFVKDGAKSWPFVIKDVMTRFGLKASDLLEAGVPGKLVLEASIVKEPWQMTKDEYAKSIGGEMGPDRRYPSHRKAVAAACREGKTVPKEVLAEYPGMAEQNPVGSVRETAEATVQVVSKTERGQATESYKLAELLVDMEPYAKDFDDLSKVFVEGVQEDVVKALSEVLKKQVISFKLESVVLNAGDPHAEITVLTVEDGVPAVLAADRCVIDRNLRRALLAHFQSSGFKKEGTEYPTQGRGGPAQVTYYTKGEDSYSMSRAWEGSPEKPLWAAGKAEPPRTRQYAQDGRWHPAEVKLRSFAVAELLREAHTKKPSKLFEQGITKAMADADEEYLVQQFPGIEKEYLKKVFFESRKLKEWVDMLPCHILRTAKYSGEADRGISTGDRCGLCDSAFTKGQEVFLVEGHEDSDRWSCQACVERLRGEGQIVEGSQIKILPQLPAPKADNGRRPLAVRCIECSKSNYDTTLYQAGSAANVFCVEHPPQGVTKEQLLALSKTEGRKLKEGLEKHITGYLQDKFGVHGYLSKMDDSAEKDILYVTVTNLRVGGTTVQQIADALAEEVITDCAKVIVIDGATDERSTPVDGYCPLFYESRKLKEATKVKWYQEWEGNSQEELDITVYDKKGDVITGGIDSHLTGHWKQDALIQKMQDLAEIEGASRVVASDRSSGETIARLVVEATKLKEDSQRPWIVGYMGLSNFEDGRSGVIVAAELVDSPRFHEQPGKVIGVCGAGDPASQDGYGPVGSVVQIKKDDMQGHYTNMGAFKILGYGPQTKETLRKFNIRGNRLYYFD